MKRLRMGGIAFVLALTFVVSGSLLAQKADSRKIFKLELPTLKLRKPACCETDAERAECPKCSKKSDNLVTKLKRVSLWKSCPDCSRKETCAICEAAASEKKTDVVANLIDTTENVVEKTTDKVKSTLTKLRDRIKEGVKRDKADK